MVGVDDDDELTFELLAAATAKLMQQILAEPRERPCADDIWNGFQEMKAGNTNEARGRNTKREPRGS